MQNTVKNHKYAFTVFVIIRISMQSLQRSSGVHDLMVKAILKILHNIKQMVLKFADQFVFPTFYASKIQMIAVP